MDKGVEVNASDFQADLRLSKDSYNVLMGINKGLGPRFGMAPLPYHGRANVPTVPITEAESLIKSEVGLTDYPDSNNRLKFYGIVPISMAVATGFNPSAQDFSQKVTHYAWILGRRIGATNDIYLTIAINANVVVAGLTFRSFRSQNLYDGLSYSVFGDGTASIPLMHVGNIDINDYLKIGDSSVSTSEMHFLRFSALSLSGKEVPMKYFAGDATTGGSGTDAPSLELWRVTSAAPVVGGGVPTSYQTRIFRNPKRQLTVHSLAGGFLNRSYRYTDLDLTTASFAARGTFPAGSITSLTAGAATAVDNRLDGVPGGADMGLVVDEENTVNSAMSLVFVAARKAFCFVSQDWLSATKVDGVDANFQLVPLTSKVIDPPVNANGAYTESESGAGNAVNKPTSFRLWPNFVAGTPLPTDATTPYDNTTPVTLGAPGTGVLRANTVYEFTYSIYDKLYDRESNVGAPVKFQTRSDQDFVRLSLYRDEKTGGGVFRQRYNGVPGGIVPAIQTTPDFGVGVGRPYYFLNYYEFRFYYRPKGSFEWLPALFIDAARYFYDPNMGILWACEGAIAALPGGQPGGLNDYSPLPNEPWTDVCTFQERVFWMSAKSLVWSYRKNPFSYALRNSSACPSGEYRGILVYVGRGQSEQQLASRIIIFGSEAVYIGRFTGERITQPVQVSPDTIETFPQEGSDFVIDFWSSFTSFSARSAVVADGELYYWGPLGIFWDNGTSPERISQSQEPDIYSLFDPNRTDEIHATYSTQTKEIIWFYPPRDLPNETHSIVYNTEEGKFTPLRFAGKIDAAQALPLAQRPTGSALNNLRTIVTTRKTDADDLQRAAFFDVFNRSGDIFPTHEAMISTVTTPQAGRRRFSGYFGGADLSSVVIGDKVCIHQAKKYASTMTSADDFIARVVAVDAIGGTFDVDLPSGVAFDAAATLADDKNFPVWFERFHGFPYVLKGNYWMPAGVNFYAYWLFVYMLFKLRLLPSAFDQTFNFGYRSPTSPDFATDIITFVNNSDGNQQCYHPLAPVNENFEGQALKIMLSGTHLGSEWVLQYLEAHAQTLEGDQLKTFEG